jgi:hypothetical protein
MKEEKLMQHDPLAEADAILSEDFYGRPLRTDLQERNPRRRAAGTMPPQDGGEMRAISDKPTHYKVICISMYTQDIADLDAKVTELKRRGWTKANKSQLIRLALSQLNLDSLSTPRQ